MPNLMLLLQDAVHKTNTLHYIAIFNIYNRLEKCHPHSTFCGLFLVNDMQIPPPPLKVAKFGFDHLTRTGPIMHLIKDHEHALCIIKLKLFPHINDTVADWIKTLDSTLGDHGFESWVEINAG